MLLWGVAEDPLDHVGIDDAGADGVDVNVLRRVVEGRALCYANNAPL